MNKKQRIVLTMLELVVKQGIHATPMSQLAREANVAVGTIYHHFKNKQEIIEEIYNMIYKDFGVVLMTNVFDDLDYKTQFEIVWTNLYNYFVTNPLAFKFTEWVGVPPVITPQIVNNAKPYYNNVKDFFLKGIKEKHLKNIDLKIVIQMAYGNVISAVRLKTRGELEMNKQQIKYAIEASWDTIKFTK